MALTAALFGSLASLGATTIVVVPVHEPLSLHGSDGDDAISDIGEALQATVMDRPMAMTGAFPEVIVDAIATPHKIPTNNPNYQVEEANLLILCQVGIQGEVTDEGLLVRLDISNLTIPEEVDLTSRQVMKLALVALRKTLYDYQQNQASPLNVSVMILGAEGNKASLADLAVKFTLDQGASAN